MARLLARLSAHLERDCVGGKRISTSGGVGRGKRGWGVFLPWLIRYPTIKTEAAEGAHLDLVICQCCQGGDVCGMRVEQHSHASR